MSITLVYYSSFVLIFRPALLFFVLCCTLYYSSSAALHTATKILKPVRAHLIFTKPFNFAQAHIAPCTKKNLMVRTYRMKNVCEGNTEKLAQECRAPALLHVKRM